MIGDSDSFKAGFTRDLNLSKVGKRGSTDETNSLIEASNRQLANSELIKSPTFNE